MFDLQEYLSQKVASNTKELLAQEISIWISQNKVLAQYLPSI